MANKVVVFVNESRATKEVKVDYFYEDLSHITPHLTNFSNGKSVLKWGDFLYSLNKVNEPIRLFKDLIQIIELKQVGHYYVVDTSDDDGKTWDFLESSKSFTDYDECYNSMKQEATSMLASEIDITQDFDFTEENTHSMQITFGHDYIVYHYSGKIMRFTMCGDW